MNLNKNIQFDYFHRDGGNYKIFGSRIFTNKKGLALKDIEEELRKNFIDGEYFFPKKLPIPLLDGSHSLWGFSDWYEFEEISYTNEEEKLMVDILNLLLKVKSFKNASS